MPDASEPVHASAAEPPFGILTLATPNDSLKAIGLALSAKISNPDVPLAVACSAEVAPLLKPHFDYVIEEKAGLRGFVHKVYLDQYSPFKQTFFFDSDVLLFRDVRSYVAAWGNPSYAAVGRYETGGMSFFGLDRFAVMRKLGRQRVVSIDGAGHALFTKPGCFEIFDRAREVTRDYREIAGDIRYADEDVVAIVMTMMDIAPAPYGDFFSRYISARPGSMQMDATRGRCEFIWADSGKPFSPCMMHFAANEAPLAYTHQLIKLFRKFDLPIGGLLALGAKDIFETKVRWPVISAAKRLRSVIS